MADAFALMTRALERGQPRKDGSGQRRIRDLNNPADAAYLRAMHPDFDELMGSSEMDYKSQCTLDATFASKFRIPPMVEPVRAFREHTNSVDAVCWTPVKGTFVSASHDCTLKVWNAHTGICLKTLSGHMGGVFHCAASPSQRLLASCSAGAEKNLLLWQWPEARLSHDLQGHQRPVHHVTFSRDGRLVSSTDQGGSVLVHDLGRPASFFGRNQHLGAAHGSAFCREEPALLCSVGHDGFLHVTDLREDSTRVIWQTPSLLANCTAWHSSLSIAAAHDGHPIFGVEFSDLRSIFSCGADHKLKRWDLRMVPNWQRNSAEQYLGHTASIRSLALSPDQRFIVTGCEDGSCRLWRKNALEELQTAQQNIAVQLQQIEVDMRDDSKPPALRRQLRDQHASLQDASANAQREEEQLARRGYGSALLTLNGHVGLVAGCAWQDDSDQHSASILSCSWDQSIQLFKFTLPDLL